MPKYDKDYSFSIDLFEDCVPCDTVEDVKKHTNKVLLDLYEKIDRKSVNDRTPFILRKTFVRY